MENVACVRPSEEILAPITGSTGQELLRRNESLVTENRMLRQQLPGRARLSDEERKNPYRESCSFLCHTESKQRRIS